MDKNFLKIGEVAEEAGVLSSTIRHYSDLGLLKTSGYTDGGHRLYHRESTLERIAKILALSKRGMSLPDIKAELEGRADSRKILFVDDDKDVGEYVVELLAKRFPRWQVKVAADGFTAGRILADFLPDLVILDIMLPGINGFDVCAQIRGDPSLAGVKILAVTGYDTPEVKEKILACGANDYLAKPMDNNVLAARIRKLIDPEGGMERP
ncbi:MAG: hypothetical protein A2902_01705 [Elusimicrobia bacterium RIFCSPLOWO2_01_FULL_64_13]|nr:MAG: hypothetical protein A2636_03890 [Elusimicrobia bacterium RIFCSPHIGHO2_01_FULL_64_10]OGR96745.1 MAG: hypothetical protein A2902_01705 [Elusimicrobia bacterium RIFCSPLOWO2_01_FULL_64_13]